MREIVLDTETTGLDPLQGHRIIEIGCLELYNLMPTGKTFHTYLNPERDVPPEASAVSGIKTEELQDKPLFRYVVDDFLNFIGDTPLVIHNAKFDMGFLNAELVRAKRTPLPYSQAIDTLLIARKKFPGSPASLDALCRRFSIDLSGRKLHGALLDSELLAKVYLELRGGRQKDLMLEAKEVVTFKEEVKIAYTAKQLRTPRLHQPTDHEMEAHRAFIGSIKNSLWN